MPRRAVVVSFDHLHLGYLGCYGNDWIETPNLDRIATQSVVFDRHFAENLDPAAGSHAWWTGCYQCLANNPLGHRDPTAVDRLQAVGVKTWLFIESDRSDGHFVAPAFDEVVTIRGVDSLEAAEDTPPFARLVQTVVQRLPLLLSADQPSLLWLKCRGVPDPWLPPREFADLYLDEFGLVDESSALDDDDSVEDSDYDDDPEDGARSRSAAIAQLPPAEAEALLELKYARALYAAYVSWLDRWIGKLYRELERSPGWDETLLVITAAAGQALGEHGRLGERGVLLREEWIHTPLVVRTPDRGHDATRCSALVQTVDLAPTLVEWFTSSRPNCGHNQEAYLPHGPIDAAIPNPIPLSIAGSPNDTDDGLDPALRRPAFCDGHSLLPLIRDEVDAIRSQAIIGSPDEWGLRTDGYLFVRPRSPAPADEDEGAASGLLFEKPHDRWDQSDVASQHLEIVAKLHSQLSQDSKSIRDLCALKPSKNDIVMA